jgi:hypothetical protein
LQDKTFLFTTQTTAVLDTKCNYGKLAGPIQHKINILETISGSKQWETNLKEAKNCLTLHNCMVDETTLRQSSRSYLITTIYTYTYFTLPHSHLTISKDQNKHPQLIPGQTDWLLQKGN